MAALVRDYLAADLKRRWEYGQVDCTMFVCDWIHARSGHDIAGDMRGTYDEQGYIYLLQSAGGILSWAGRRLSAIGWQRVDEADDGDVAVVRAPLLPHGGIGHIPAISAGGMWVVRCETGQRSSALFEPKAIWRA